MRWIKKACMPLMVLLAISLFIVSDYIVNKPKATDPTDKRTVMDKDEYNSYGLPVGTELKEQPFYQDENLVAYKDRLLKKFHYEDINVQNMAKVAQGLAKSLPSDIPFYMVPIPGRITLEEGYQEDQEGYEEFLSALIGQLQPGVTFLNVLPELAAHREEYVFFRGEEGWTARGAYYGSKVICEGMGIVPFPLAGYEEYMFIEFEGGLLQDSKKVFAEGTENYRLVEEVPPDVLYYYLLAGSKNIEEIGTTVDGVSVTEKRPLIRKSGLGKSTFVGSGHDWAVVEGDAMSEEKKDGSLLLISDASGNLLAPYFANYYKKVYVVNIREYENLNATLGDILKEYDIKDVVLAQTASEMGNLSLSKALSGFLTNEE